MNKWKIAAVGWCLLTLSLSLIPNREFPKTFFDEIFGIDKIGHLMFYLIMTYLWYKVISIKYVMRNAVVLSALFSFGFGLMIEVLQKVMTSDRNFDGYDLVANGLGVIFGSYLIFKYENVFTIFARSIKKRLN